MTGSGAPALLLLPPPPPQAVKAKKLTYVQGMARFKDSGTLEVTANDGTVGEMSFEQVICATGSRPIMLPGVDAVYMDFVQKTTGSGGWPMSVFLTPEAKPFYGGTYFPPSGGYGA